MKGSKMITTATKKDGYRRRFRTKLHGNFEIPNIVKVTNTIAGSKYNSLINEKVKMSSMNPISLNRGSQRWIGELRWAC